MGVQPLNAQRAKTPAGHTPGDFVAGVDVDHTPAHIGVRKRGIVVIGCHKYLQRLLIAPGGAFRNIHEIRPVRLGRKELLVSDFALDLHNPFPDLFMRCSHWLTLLLRQCGDRIKDHIVQKAVELIGQLECLHAVVVPEQAVHIPID